MDVHANGISLKKITRSAGRDALLRDNHGTTPKTILYDLILQSWQCRYTVGGAGDKSVPLLEIPLILSQ